MGRAESGESEDWSRINEIVERWQGPLIRYADNMLRDRERAKDVVQDVFVKLCAQPWEKVEHCLAPWLFRVTRNRALDTIRKETRMQYMDDADTAENVCATVGDQRQDSARQVGSSLLEIVEEMPAKQKEAILLKFQQDLSYREIGEVMGISQSNVGYILHHALKDLKERWNAIEAS